MAVIRTRRGQSHCPLHRRDARHVATSQRLVKGEGRRIERNPGRVHRTSEEEADVPVPRQRREQGRRRTGHSTQRIRDSTQSTRYVVVLVFTHIYILIILWVIRDC